MEMGGYRIFVVLFVIFAVIEGNKYSKEHHVGQYDMDSDRPFRMNKINLLWQKGKKRTTASSHKELFTDLKTQDNLELEAKSKYASGFDEDGEFAAATRNKLVDIMIKYKLQEHYDIDEHVGSRLKEQAKDKAKSLKLESIKMDNKLGKLWKKAEMAGFSDEELVGLKHEFSHHQQKVDEYNILKNEIDQVPDISENSVHRFSAEKDGQTGDLLKNNRKRNDALKRKHKELQYSYEQLEILSGRKEAGGDADFSEPKVIELWLQAKKSNFTELELASFKEELRHFEHKLKKHEFLRTEVHHSAQAANMHPDKTNDHLPDSHLKLERRTKEYAYKLKKIHTELKSRLASSHTEL